MPRRSGGGTAVEQSLMSAGFRVHDADVALVETSRPGLRAHATVLVQNAWNFLPDTEFRALAQPYPSSMRRRMRQRRQLARFNSRRAARVVALTQPMADLAGGSLGRLVQVSEVVYPLSVLDPVQDPSGLPKEPFVLVPGTITWYKDPLAAIEVVAARTSLPRRIVFAGSDDGSGCWAEVQQVASTRGVQVTGGPVAGPVMRSALERATAVILSSRLESLGFSLSEALALAPGEVIASPLPSHRRLAEHIGRAPVWLGQRTTDPPGPGLPALPDLDEVRSSWISLGHCLGLSRIEETW